MIKIVYLKSEYIDYLRQFDQRVCYNKGQTRPYIGILFTIKNLKYYAPLSSPKPKHLKMKDLIDVIRIDSGKLGIINLNNMIPVKRDSIINFNIMEEINEQYRQLLIKQVLYFKDNEERILNRALTLYNSYMKNTLSQATKERCCDFKLLEEKAKLYQVNYKSKNKDAK